MSTHFSPCSSTRREARKLRSSMRERLAEKSASSLIVCRASCILRRSSISLLISAKCSSKNGSSGVAVDITTYRRGQAPRTESTVALQVERQALEESCDVPQSIAAPLQHVQLGVQPFDKAARVMVDDGVGNPIQPGIQQLQECIEASQAALFDPPPPEADAPQPLFLRGCTVDED